MSTFEDALMKATVDQFFKPLQTGTNSATGEAYYGASPVSMVTNGFFNQNREKLTKLIVAKLDVQEIADKVYAQLAEHLTKTEKDRYGYDSSTAIKKEFNESVRKQVVKLVAQDAAAKLIASQDKGSDLSAADLEEEASA